MVEEAKTEERMSPERVKEIAAHLLDLRVRLTQVSADEVKEILHGLSQDEAIGPLLNPSAWQGDRFDANRRSRDFLEKLLALKAVSDY